MGRVMYPYPDQNDKERRDERQYVERQIASGRSLADLHRVIDSVAQGMIRQLRGADTDRRHVTAKRDVLLSAAEDVADHLRSIGSYGGADDVLAALEQAMEHAR